MNRSRKIILALIRYLPVLVLFILSVHYVADQLQEVTKSANLIAMDELSHRLNKEVKIGRVRITPLGTAILEDVRVASGKTFKSGTLITAQEIRIHYNWRAMLLKGRGAQSIRRIDINNSWLLLVRKRDGTFNIQELLKRPPGPQRPPFEAIVHINGGEVLFKDYRAQISKLPAITRLYKLNGSFDAAKRPIYAFAASGTSTKNRFKFADAVGVYNSDKHTIRFDLSATDASAAYWSHYFGLLKSFDIRSGKLRVLAGVSVKSVKGTSQTAITGVAKIANGVVTVPRIKEPVRDVSGRVMLVGSKAVLSLIGTAADSRIRVKGSVRIFDNPILALALSSSSLNYTRFLSVVDLPESIHQIQPSGRGPVVARISGTVSNPLVLVNADIPKVSTKGYNARNLRMAATYRNGLLRVHSARFTTLGGQFTTSGLIDLNGVPKISATGRVAGLAVTSLPIPSNIKATGTVNAAFTLSGEIANPMVQINARIPGGRLNGVYFGSAVGQFRYNNGQVHVANLVIYNIEGGTARISGMASSSALKLSVIAQGINIGKLAKAFGRPGVEGTGFFQGQITGTPSEPAFAGVLEAFNARYGQYVANYARVQFAGERQTVEITGAVIRLFPAEIAFTGRMTMLPSGNIAFNGQAHVERLTLSKLQETLGTNSDISGVVVGDLQASGVLVPHAKTAAAALRNTIATGTLKIEDGTAFGYPISTSTVRVAFRNDKLAIEEATIVSQESTIALGGAVSIDTGNVDLNFQLSGFQLARLQRMLNNYAVVSGTANAHGTISGPLGEVRAQAAVGIDGLTVNGKRFDTASLDLSYSNDTVDSMQATLKRNDQQYAVQVAGYDIRTNCMQSATGTLNNISVPDLWDIITSSPEFSSESAKTARETFARVPRLTSGTVNAKFQLNGCLDSPDGTINLTAENVGVDVQQIEKITLEASADKGVVTMHSTVASGETVVDIMGSPLFKDGHVQLSVDARNLDLSRLRPWLGVNTPGGTATVEFEVSGSVLAPVVLGSIEVVKPSFHGVEFDNLRVSRIEVRGGRIDISDVILAIDGHQAVAQGSVPWDWSTFSVPNDLPLKLTANLRQEDLAILGTFSHSIDAARTQGAVTAQIQVSGTLANPLLSGNLTVTDGTLAIKGFTNDFTNLNIGLDFDGKQIVFQQMSMSSSLGGNARVVPGSYLTIGDLDTSAVNLMLQTQGFMIAEKNLMGFQEDVNMQLDAGLSVTGTLARPIVANAAVDSTPGGLAMSNAKISFITPTALPTRTGLVLPINPTFNVSINVGQNVWVAPPSVSMRIAGRGSLTGTLADPNLEMNLKAQEGSIKVAGRRLRIVPGGTILARYAPPEETVARFDFSAVTSVVATNPLGQTERYEITLHVTGPVNDLQIGLTSNPGGLAKEQMLAALGHLEGVFTSGEVGLQRELGNILGAVGASTLFAPIENLFVERFGFEQFNVEFGPEVPLAIFISRRLTGNFFVSYYQQMMQTQSSVRDIGYAVTLNYKLKKYYFLSAGVDAQDTFTFQAGFSRSFR